MRKQAEEFARQRVSEHEVTQEARKKAAEMIASAEQRAREVMHVAGEYCDDAMKRTEDALSQTLSEMKQSRVQFLQALKEQNR